MPHFTEGCYVTVKGYQSPLPFMLTKRCNLTLYTPVTYTKKREYDFVFHYKPLIVNLTIPLFIHRIIVKVFIYDNESLTLTDFEVMERFREEIYIDELEYTFS